MTIQLPADLERSLQAAVQSGHFASADDLVAQIVRDYLQRAHGQALTQDQTAGQGDVPVLKPIWERILERSAAIPEEEWDKLPPDGAEQHDHYLYGTRKRPSPP